MLGDSESDAPVSLPDAGATPTDALVARVQGQVFVEVPRPPPEPVVEVVLDSAGGVKTRIVPAEGTGDTGAGSGTDAGLVAEPTTSEDSVAEAGPAADSDPASAPDPEPSALDPTDELDPPPTPAPVDLQPPPEDQCTVIAWQQGTRVSEPTPCQADGHFEVALEPGRHGRTAFEVLVSGHLRAVLEVEVPEGGTGRLPPVALGAAVHVEGQVVDSRGDPLPGIVIEAMPSPNLGEPEPWRATSGSDGRFVFDTLPPGPVSLRAQPPGYAVSVVEAIAPQSEILITLQALVDLEGRVVGPPEALARARVRIEGSGIWPVREQEVQADGRFVLPQVPDGIYALEAVVEAEHPGEPELASIPLENVTPELSLTLALVPAFRVPVEVRAPDGTAVSGARVTLSNSSIGLLPRLSVTDEVGHVSMGPVVPGPYVLRAHADGLLPSPPVALTVDGSGEGSGIPLQVLTLAEPGRIEGRVVDEDDHPVEGARVELLAEHLFTVGEGQTRARFAQASLRAAGSLGVTTGPVPEVPTGEGTRADLGTTMRTGEDGRFAFGMLAPGRYRLQAHHGHYARSEEQAVRLGAAGTRVGVRLVLRTGHRLTGRVRDGNDRPVSGAMVRFDDGRVVYTDRRGVFDGGIHRGRRRLVARAAGLAPATREVVVRDEPVDVEVVLGRARAQLHGRVVGENGEILADARVTLRAVDGLSATRIAWTDAKGVYRFDDLPPGTIEVEIDHADHGPVTQRVELSEEDAREQVDVALVRGWALEVEVLAEGTGTPLPGVKVSAGGVHARTDGDGMAILRRLSQERVRVSVHAEGLGSATREVSRDGAERRQVRVELTEGGGLRGRVIDYRGDPVAGVEVVVRDSEGAVLGRTRTDGRGRWSMSGIAAGDVEVSAEPPVDREDEIAPATLSSDVLRGHVTRDVDLRFDRR